MSTNQPLFRLHLNALVLLGLVTTTIHLATVPLVAQEGDLPAVTVVNAGGHAILTSPPPDGGAPRGYPLQFAIIAGYDEAGHAAGAVTFQFGKAFSRDWGIDPPDQSALYLFGKISGISQDSDGSILLTGIVTELDFTASKGVVFLIDDPFEIRVDGSLSQGQFTLLWCELPVFPVRVTHGVFEVNPLP